MNRLHERRSPFSSSFNEFDCRSVTAPASNALSAHPESMVKFWKGSIQLSNIYRDAPRQDPTRSKIITRQWGPDEQLR